MDRGRSTFLTTFAGVPLLVVLALLTTARPVTSDDAEGKATQTTMRQIFQSLATAFTFSVSEQRFEDPANRQQILVALEALSENATRFGTHGRELNPSFNFLSRSLARDAHEAMKLCEEGQYKSSRFVLRHITENCFACHSGVPSPRRFDLGKRFLEDVKIENLPLRNRVRLEVATRQFDTALQTYEAMFRSPSALPTQIALRGAFEDYLKIAIRVRNDFARSIATLEEFRQRSDVPRYLTSPVGWKPSKRRNGTRQRETS